MNSIRVAVVCLTGLLPCVSHAAGLAINPGLWETTMTQTNPITGQSTSETKSRCIQETVFDPADMMQNAQGCELVENNVSGNTLSFRMECNMQGSQATITGKFQTDGQTGQGEMEANVNAGGQTMTMNMNWQSRRLGNC